MTIERLMFAQFQAQACEGGEGEGEDEGLDRRDLAEDYSLFPAYQDYPVEAGRLPELSLGFELDDGERLVIVCNEWKCLIIIMSI